MSPQPGIPATKPAAPAIAVRELTRRFGDFTAVDGVSFDVAKGEIFGFLGPNGAGKTTTIRMLTGLLPPSSGSGVVAGFDISGDTRGLREQIGYMSQSFSLYPDLTVEENIELFGGLYAVTNARFTERRAWVLRMAGLQQRERARTGELPLGFKQRLALGCAVLHEPSVLFLDEPTSGVDPLARRSFWDLIHALAAHGTTVLVSTHYMEEAEYCHRLLLMNRGRLVASGTPSQLRERMTQTILEIETDNAPLAVAALAASRDVEEAAMFGRSVHVVLTDATTAHERVAAILNASGRPIHAIRTVDPSLEDVFVSLVRREGGAVVG